MSIAGGSHLRSLARCGLDPIIAQHPYVRATAGLVALTLALIGCWLIWRPDHEFQLSGYLPLHAFLETCAIVVFVLVFIVSRTSFGDQRNRNMMLIGAAFLGVAVLDFLHTQSYEGMPDLITRSGPEKAINFWLAARLLAAGSLAAVAFMSWERMQPAHHCSRWTGGILFVVVSVSLVILYRPHWVPATLVRGEGLTAFRIVIELVIVALSLIAAFGLCRLAQQPAQRGALSVKIDPVALMSATVVLALAGTFFTFHADAKSFFNLLGHAYKVIGAWFLYRGLVTSNLEEDRTRSALALEAAGLGVWNWDIASDRLEIDERSAEIYRLPPGAEITMSAVQAMVHPEDRAERLAALSRALDPLGNGLYACEFKLLSPSGGETRQASSMGRIEFSDGRAVRMIGVVSDVTERRRAENDLRRSEARLSGILAIAADAIISIDDDHRITMFNHGAEKIFGYNAADVIGLPLDRLIPSRFHATHGSHIRHFAESGATARRMGERREIFGLRKDGGEFPAEASISMLEVGGQRIFTVVLRDITARREYERRMAEATEELEARVLQRTSELSAETERRLEAQAALARSQRMEAFGQLAGGIAHDFNNLLTVISGNQELLEMRLKEPRDLTLLKRSQQAAEMGARLTSRLLTFARRRRLEPTLINLNEQITSMVELLRRSIGEDIALTTNLAPQLWSVRADASEIENAVLNLAINARDAMPGGGSLIIETADCTIEPGEIGGERPLAPGDYVRVSVSDTGTGMPPEVMARAFEPFFTTKPPGKGTGLGLSTIYGFVQQSGGTVTARSRPGEGTTVSIYLPRAVTPAGQRRVDRPGNNMPLGLGEKVLVVEDNASVRAVTVKHLEDLGYLVREVETGVAAKEIFREPGHGIDLVLSDVVMPGGMSGFDVASWVGACAPGVKVLLMSGYPDQAAMPTAAQPALRILSKPYSRIELARAVREVLDSPEEPSRQ